MAKHDQKPDTSRMVCASCKAGMCSGCVDLIRRVYASEPICSCNKGWHKQVVGMSKTHEQELAEIQHGVLGQGDG